MPAFCFRNTDGNHIIELCSDKTSDIFVIRGEYCVNHEKILCVLRGFARKKPENDMLSDILSDGQY